MSDEALLRAARTDLAVIAVQNYGSSGSLFLHSLLDSHPEALVLPGPYGIQYYATWAAHIENDLSRWADYARMRSWVLDTFFLGLVDPAPTYQFGLTELGDDRRETAAVDKERFGRAFDVLVHRMAEEEGLPGTSEIEAHNVHLFRSVCLRAVYFAYAFCAGQDLSNKRFLVYPAHSSPMRDIEPLCADFERVRFVHLVREPVQNLDSMQRLLVDLVRDSTPELDLFSCVVNQIYYDRAPQAPVCGVPLYSIYPYPTARPGCSVAVRLEDLHLRPEDVLSELCRWLGLRWDGCLLCSTFAGKKWWNRPGMRRVNGFSRAIIGRSAQFGAFDAWRFRRLASPIRGHFRYAAPAGTFSHMEDLLALICCVLPFGLELRCFNVKRYDTERRSRLRSGIAGRVLLWSIFVPAGMAADYVEHRVTMLRGFILNRRRRTRFVPLMTPQSPSVDNATQG